MSNKTDPFRRVYSPLNDDQKSLINDIKDCADELWTLFNEIESTDPRCSHIAKTRLEESVMWAVKGVTNARSATD